MRTKYFITLITWKFANQAKSYQKVHMYRKTNSLIKDAKKEINKCLFSYLYTLTSNRFYKIFISKLKSVKTEILQAIYYKWS